MKRNRRILSLLLAICLVAVLIPAVATAETDVYLPANILDDEVVSYAGKDWIVMSNNSTEMVLLLRTPEDAIAYNASGLSNAWQDSTADNWCKTFARDNGIPFEVFFLSQGEVITYYANNSLADLKTENGWWLRHEGEDIGDVFGIAISNAGFMGMPHVAANYGARPAVRIPADKIATVGFDGVKWTLKVVDDAFTNFSAEITVASDHKTATVACSNAESGMITVVLTDRVGNVLKSESFEATNDPFTVNLLENMMGWYTLRVFNEAGDAVSNVIKHSFNIADSHGEVKGYEANVKGDVSVNFAIDIKVDPEDAYVQVTTPSGTQTVKVTELAGSTQSGADKSLVVSVKAPQMSDEITIRVYNSKGSGAKQTFTVREYMETIIKDVNGEFSTEAEELAKQMLNYGANAQTYFGYNATNLANKNIGYVEQVQVPNQNLKATVSNSVEGITFHGASLVMDAKTGLRFYFTLANDKSIKDYTFMLGETALNVTYKSKMYYVEASNIAPNLLDSSFEVTVRNGDDSMTVSYNPMSYIQRQHHSASCPTNLKNMLQALYNYHLAAKAYESNHVD